MPEIIFHQYDTSPFSEKVRVCFGIKGLSWAAVDQPVIMPKPELLALTGAYRRIPVMQIGADIYCDSQLIVAELERRYPTPTLFPAGDAGLAQAMTLWTDRAFFQAAVAIIFGGAGFQVDEAFMKDREALSGRPFDAAAMAAAGPHMRGQLRAQLDWLETQLADGRSFLTGGKPGLADANAFYNLWFVRRAYPPAAALFGPFAGVVAWEERVGAIGHGERSSMSREEALDIARAATSTAVEAADGSDPEGFKPGDRVIVAADDYGRDPVAGVLVASSPGRIAIRRSDPRVGEVVVHFPRAGYALLKAG